MADPKLVAWVKDQSKAGYSTDQIKNTLTGSGYAPADIDAAIAEVQKTSPVPAPPSPTKPAEEPKKDKFMKFLGLAGILTGVLFLITSILAIYLVLTTGFLEIMSMSLAVIQLIAGIFWVLVGIKGIRR